MRPALWTASLHFNFALYSSKAREKSPGYLRTAGNASERKRKMIDKSTAASEAASKAFDELKPMPSGEQYTVDFFLLEPGRSSRD